MNIIEAIKSGRPFRRKIWIQDYFRPIDGYRTYTLDEGSLTADDWEIEEEFLTITREDLWKACDSLPELFSPNTTDRIWSALVIHMKYKE